MKMIKGALVVLLSTLLVACAVRMPGASNSFPALPAAPAVLVAKGAPAPKEPCCPDDAEGDTRWLDASSVYFDQDALMVRPEHVTRLAVIARYLIENPRKRILVVGNTDERGKSRYNLALGKRRAESVCARLVALGVADAQLDAISLGETEPRAKGNAEAFRALNRRVDFVAL
jgi:peptidoglycan-associated lipoprotein